MQTRQLKQKTSSLNSISSNIWNAAKNIARFVLRNPLKVGVLLLARSALADSTALVKGLSPSLSLTEVSKTECCPSYNGIYSALNLNLQCHLKECDFENSPLIPELSEVSPVEEFIQSQETIRIFAVAVGNFGHLAATLTVMNKLRQQLGFQGIFEVIYPSMDIRQISTIFDLPKDIPSIYYDRENKIQYITLDEQITRFRNQKIEPLTLGMSGAADDNDPTCVWSSLKLDSNDQDMCQNVAKLLNVKIYASVTHDPHNKGYQGYAFQPGDEFFLLESDKRHIVTEINTFFTAPRVNLELAKNYLSKDTSVRLKKPALDVFIKGMEAGSFDVMPIYGRTLKDEANDDYLANILQVVTGVRHAQLTSESVGIVKKPIIIAVFHDYEKEFIKINEFFRGKTADVAKSKMSDRSASKTNLDLQVEETLAAMMKKMGMDTSIKKSSSSWADKAKTAIKKVKLDEPNTFFTTSLSDVDSIGLIESLQSNQIILLSMGSFPKLIFDGIFTHSGSNILPQIREGFSTLSTLLLTGRPHFICAQTQHKAKWDVGFDLISDPSLMTRLTNFYGENGFCGGAMTWEHNAEVYKEFGNLINQARLLGSPFSQYFQLLKEQASKPENDRVRDMLAKAARVMKGDKSALGVRAIDLPRWQAPRMRPYQ